MNDLTDRILTTLLGILFVFMVGILVVFLPASLYVEAKCLEAGHPKGVVTWKLDFYCVSLDGSTRTEVNKLK
jgi:hypothetical protein